MKKIAILLLTLLLFLPSSITTFAANGKVTYSGNAGKFVFEPGSRYSPTDLFPNFKDVMPGDSLIQKITVRNEADDKIKVKIYLRSLGAHEDSVEFLSQLKLKVKKSDDNTMAYMFDADANETAQLTDWICLGTLYSGGKVNLDVILDVPVELDNKFQNEIGYLDWEFMIEEFPIEPSDPSVPPAQTDDDSNFRVWATIMLSSLSLLIILLVWHKKDKENKNNAMHH